MMRGLGRRPYESYALWHVIMDCRVKPGNDSGEYVARSTYPTNFTRLCCMTAPAEPMPREVISQFQAPGAPSMA